MTRASKTSSTRNPESQIQSQKRHPKTQHLVAMTRARRVKAKAWLIRTRVCRGETSGRTIQTKEPQNGHVASPSGIDGSIMNA
jgi:hypothetical protein